MKDEPMKNKNIITEWLDKYGDPETERFIENNLAITEKVRLALEAKGWSKAEFAEAMGKNPSEVSKWLSGMHNLTLKSLTKMELVLGIDLLNNKPEQQYKSVYLGLVEGSADYDAKATEYEAYAPQQKISVAI